MCYQIRVTQRSWQGCYCMTVERGWTGDPRGFTASNSFTPDWEEPQMGAAAQKPSDKKQIVREEWISKKK